MNRNCVIYCRVSSIGDRQSNERQMKDLEEYAKSKSLESAGIYEEKISGAKKNAERNKLSNAEFFCGKAEEVLPAFYRKEAFEDNGGNSDFVQDKSRTYGEKDGYQGQQLSEGALHPDVIVVDPPRKGCDEACLDTMLKMAPERIVYVSCDSATLARDLRILVDGGYELKAIRACDMFSHTVHVESVVKLTRAGVSE